MSGADIDLISIGLHAIKSGHTVDVVQVDHVSLIIEVHMHQTIAHKIK
jgi:hypothetical protein